MPKALTLTEAALADFDRLYDFIARHNPRSAAGVLRKLDAAVLRLADQPKLGREYKHGRFRLRVLTHGDYLVFYRERPAAIEVVRVLHGRQNIPDILDDI